MRGSLCSLNDRGFKKSFSCCFRLLIEMIFIMNLSLFHNFQLDPFINKIKINYNKISLQIDYPMNVTDF